MAIRIIILLILCHNLLWSQSGLSGTLTVSDTLSSQVNYTSTTGATDNQIINMSISNDSLIVVIQNGNTQTVDLSPYLDDTDTDNQTITAFSVDTLNILTLTLEDGNTATVDLSNLNIEDTPQVLDLTGNTLSLNGGGGSVSLAAYLDDTDTDDQNLSNSKTGVDVTVNITDGTGTTFSVSDLDNDPANELYDDTELRDSITDIRTDIQFNLDEINTNAAAILLRLLIPTTCSSGQVLKYNGTTFTCQADATTGDPDGYVSDFSLSGTTLTLTGVGSAYDGTVSFSGWDTDGSNDVLTTTTFSGDVSGTYDNLQVDYSESNLPQFTIEGRNPYNASSNNIDFVCSGCTLSSNANSITWTVASSATNLGVGTTSCCGTGSALLTSSTGNNVAFAGLTGSGRTPVTFGTGSSSGQSYISGYVTETDPNVDSHIKSITTTDITNWNTAHGRGDHSAVGYLTSEVDGSTTNELQTINKSGATVTLSNGGGSYTDDSGTDDQNIDVLAFNPANNVLTVGIEDGSDRTISLSALDNDTNLSQEEVQDYIGTMVTGNTESGISVTYDDAANEFDFVTTDQSATNELQTLGLSGNTLSLTDGGSVSLGSYLDNTDTQDLSLSGNTLSLTDGGSVSLAGYLDNTDAQQLGISGSTLTLTNSTGVTLADNDSGNELQSLSISGTTLSISDGNSVTIPQDGTGTDDQTLSEVFATESGSQITAIHNENVYIATTGIANSISLVASNNVLLSANNQIQANKAITVTSDKRHKDHIQDLTWKDTEQFYSVLFKSYELIADSSNRKTYGVIAQELQQTHPELVHTDSNGMLSVNYTGLFALMGNVIQRQKSEIIKQQRDIEYLGSLTNHFIDELATYKLQNNKLNTSLDNLLKRIDELEKRE